MEETEIWVDVLGYEGYYKISNTGFVKRLFDRDGNFVNKVLQMTVDKNRYINISLCKGANGTRYRLHRLLMIAFEYIPNYKEMDVRHIDGNPSNNKLANLAWCTHLENMQDKKVHGTTPNFEGSKNPAAILNEEKVLIIKRKLVDGSKMKELALEFGVSMYAIWDIANNRSWLNVRI